MAMMEPIFQKDGVSSREPQDQYRSTTSLMWTDLCLQQILRNPWSLGLTPLIRPQRFLPPPVIIHRRFVTFTFSSPSGSHLSWESAVWLFTIIIPGAVSYLTQLSELRYWRWSSIDPSLKRDTAYCCIISKIKWGSSTVFHTCDWGCPDPGHSPGQLKIV